MHTRSSRSGVRRILWILAAVAMIVAVMPLAGATAETEDVPLRVPLLADGRNDEGLPPVVVGDAVVWDDGTNLYVDYDITDPEWCMTKTHVAVAEDWMDLPQTKKHSPIPGKFEFTNDHDCVTEFKYVIPMAGFTVGADLAIAVHANVEIPGGLDGVEFFLPETVTMSVAYPYAGGPSYFKTTIADGAMFDQNPYKGWCIDVDNTIAQNTVYTMDVFSSYEILPPNTVAFPENLDLVNYILNQGFVDQPSACGDVYTYGDVQRAIWTLVDPNSTSGLKSWSQCRVDEIIAAARLDGEGYEPGCDDVIAIILKSPGNNTQNTIVQTTIAELGVPCETRSETAWAEGTPFNGPPTLFKNRDWAMWFEYIPEEVPLG